MSFLKLLRSEIKIKIMLRQIKKPFLAFIIVNLKTGKVFITQIHLIFFILFHFRVSSKSRTLARPPLRPGSERTRISNSGKKSDSVSLQRPDQDPRAPDSMDSSLPELPEIQTNKNITFGKTIFGSFQKYIVLQFATLFCNKKKLL